MSTKAQRRANKQRSRARKQFIKVCGSRRRARELEAAMKEAEVQLSKRYSALIDAMILDGDGTPYDPTGLFRPIGLADTATQPPVTEESTT